YDAVVLDPPRAGAERQCAELAKSKIRRVFYVSCSPATFARDARILVNGGYRMGAVTPVDQFLWSSHTELVANFTRDKA
ncbi:MAG TPA: 23S rRNA (uracil(1939)-C(5))-methyltransferase, partial [Rhizomicrobium sp.]